MAMSPLSFSIGWWPPERSMIDRRRKPSADEPRVHSPSSSGPRCSRVRAMASTRSAPGARERSSNETPHNPHMVVPVRRLAALAQSRGHVAEAVRANDPELAAVDELVRIALAEAVELALGDDLESDHDRDE